MILAWSALTRIVQVELARPDAVRQVEGAMMNFTKDLPVMVTPLKR